MKVAIFCEYYANGGIEKISNELKKILIKNKYDVSILCTVYNSNLYEKCITISNKKIRNPIYRFIKTILNVKKYTKQYDIVHINIHSSIGLIYPLFIDKNKKIIIHAHNSNFDKNYFKIKSLINNLIKNLFCKEKYNYIACSKKAAEFCFKKNIKYDIIPNEIYGNLNFNKEKRKNIRNKYNIKDEIVIGHIGRFEKQKNHEFLVNIFKEFQKLNKKSKLFLIGIGSERNKIERILKNSALFDKTIIVDYVFDVEAYYSAFDFFVYPSLFEGYGICFYEALSTSLKCFISDNIYQGEKNDNLYVLSLKDSSKKWADLIYNNVDYDRKILKMSNNFEYNINKVYLNELISVIVPVYNSEKYIEDCINSILMQTYTNFELIIVNDGSTDNTAKILDKFNDSRIKIYYQENSGAGSARNLGISKSNGNYICFIDSDDTVLDNHLQYMYDLMNKYDSDIVCCNYRKKTKEKIKLLITKDDILNNLISLPEKSCMSILSKLFRKDVIKDVLFDEKNKFEDIEFCVNVFMNSNTVVYSTKMTYYYKYLQNSRSKHYFSNDRFVSCTKCLSLIPSTSIDNYLTYTCLNAIAIVNMMILNNNYIDGLVSEVNDFVKEHIVNVKKSDYSILKKMQVYLYNYNFNLYKKIYKRFK